MLILFLLFVLTRANAQNEFAATAFYTDFKKIFADAQAGFTDCKGIKRKSDFEELATEYYAKLMLPLADSGKVVFPVAGNPYVIYSPAHCIIPILTKTSIPLLYSGNVSFIKGANTICLLKSGERKIRNKKCDRLAAFFKYSIKEIYSSTTGVRYCA